MFRAAVHQQVEKEKEIHKSLPEIVSQDLCDGNGDIEPRRRSTSIYDDEDSSVDDYEPEEYDEEKKNPHGKARVEPLPKVDHSTINYPSFKKCFYKEHTSLAEMTIVDVLEARKTLEITVNAIDCPKPLNSFETSGLDSALLKEIKRIGFTKPTAIQAQSIPVILSGKDMLGLAKTGSGKTFAYVWPMIQHIINQPQLSTTDGPIALVLAPTRELVIQIFHETKKFAEKLYGLGVVPIFGGSGKWEMTKALKESPHIVIATPGRFIDMVKNKSTGLKCVTFVVLDEADRMFELGFEYQMRSIVSSIRPDRQLIMFSATMKKKIENFTYDIFDRSTMIKVVIGTLGQANEDIQQSVVITTNEITKQAWLFEHIEDFAAEGKVLIFALNKQKTEELCLSLQQYFHRRQLDIKVEYLHGDLDQTDRTKIIQRFSKRDISYQNKNINNNNGGPLSPPTSPTSHHHSFNNPPIHILIATDVAARGLDVKDIRSVINFDVPKNIDTYVHRIGRTGRMGVAGVTPGTAYTLLTKDDSGFAVDLVHNLKISSQPISLELMTLASSDPKWHRIRETKGISNNSKGGLGTRGPAMTSEMMANATNKSIQMSLPQQIQNKFTSSQPDPSYQKNYNFQASEISDLQRVPSLPQPSGPVLKGFVRSSTAYSTTNHYPVDIKQQPTVNDSLPVKKKSRWDH